MLTKIWVLNVPDNNTDSSRQMSGVPCHEFKSIRGLSIFFSWWDGETMEPWVSIAGPLESTRIHPTLLLSLRMGVSRPNLPSLESHETTRQVSQWLSPGLPGVPHSAWRLCTGLHILPASQDLSRILPSFCLIFLLASCDKKQKNCA